MMPLYFFGIRKESEAFAVPMFEGAEFAKGASNVPRAAHVVIEADEKMQIYDISIVIIAKLSGLRWILYNHRILSFLVFTSSFWVSSMISMGIMWFVLSIYLDDSKEGKQDDEGRNGSFKEESTPEINEPLRSDTLRSFPTLGRQRPLKYEGPAIKQEDEEDVLLDTALQPSQATAAEADDEDDEDAKASSSFRDSGIGTGRDERGGNGVQRRRKRGSEDIGTI